MSFVPEIYDSLYPQLEELGLREWASRLRTAIAAEFTSRRHGKMAEWQAALNGLPLIEPGPVELKERVAIGPAGAITDCDDFVKKLKVLHPWRKGPFELFGLNIDTEWRSDWKWERLRPHIAPLAGRMVLDVGCGNGYHGWRMRGEGARLVIGLDPVMLYVLQHQVIQRYLADPQHHVLPLRGEDLPADLNCFDTVFSMGVLYHRKSPFEHLLELRGALQPGGELVLETLVVEGDETTVLTPAGRYAKMRNVWFIPSVPVLEIWLARCGFTEIRCVDANRTGVDEQRATEWMIEESLADFLDPDDPLKTMEGHPAPLRAIITATKA